MASGRVGGTRSKISGSVGDVVYQIKRNPDGTYTQIVYGKPEDVTQTITPRGQAQKMCTSMVEALMRDLKEVGRVCMQSAANKSKSLNAFSMRQRLGGVTEIKPFVIFTGKHCSYNLKVIDCKDQYLRIIQQDVIFGRLPLIFNYQFNS